ncbi:hypothetical protein OPV22_007314 [Ensete ventricosum]|uniref:Protein-serine/threonine phosphatase n=1 Tax=Ensete ventricosum TaxID=4639 RepID=A0AAV8RUL2_ENSVE|nr:hypothetical protein OPV22_007301 [Ensete ventricosum]KAJ8506428.1 hypothetical protein OPV22_007314 [Ensete ventricosum]
MAIVEDFAVGSGDGRELGRRLFVAGSAPYTSAQLSMIEPHGGLVHYFPDLMKLMLEIGHRQQLLEFLGVDR